MSKFKTDKSDLLAAKNRFFHLKKTRGLSSFSLSVKTGGIAIPGGQFGKHAKQQSSTGTQSDRRNPSQTMGSHLDSAATT